MKLFRRLAIIVALAVAALAASPAYAGAPKKSGSDDKTSKLASMLGNALGAVLSSDKVSVADLEGTWAYSGPAVSFLSENMLQKAGGAAVASSLEEKLAPYFEKANLSKMVISVAADSTFTLTSGRTRLSGKIVPVVPSESSKANFKLSVTLAGAIPLASMDAYVTRIGRDRCSMMFDVSKLIDMLRLLSAVSGSSVASQVTSLLERYDGVCAGFDLTRTKQ